MFAFGLVSSKVCITYSRCPCNKLWRRLECLKKQQVLIDHLIAKQFVRAIFWKSLNNFRGEGQKRIVYKKKVY